MLTARSVPFPKISVNRASTIFDLASWTISRDLNAAQPQWPHPQPLLGNILVTISLQPPTIERPQSVHRLCGSSERYTAMNCIVLFQIKFYAVSLCNLTLYTTPQLCMHCLTDLIFSLVTVESIFKNAQSDLLYRYFRQSSVSDYPAF